MKAPSLRLLAKILLLLALRAPAQTAAPSLLTNAAGVRALTLEQASRHPAVRLQGVVLGEAEPSVAAFALHDETGGVYVYGSSAQVAQLHPGALIGVEGSVNPGEFAPFVEMRAFQSLGHAPIPAPRPVTFQDLTYGNTDAQWVEISGIVRACAPDPDGVKCRLDLATGNGRLTVRWNVAQPNQPLVDAEVLLRGVCYYEVNRERQALAPLLAIPKETPIVVLKPAPADPFSVPEQSIVSLFRFSPKDDFGHRVRVHGVVCFQQPGKLLWIENEGVGLGIQTSQPDELRVGDVVDVIGFPAHGATSPILEDASFRRLATAAPPAAIRLASAEDAFKHDAMLVQLDATLENSFPTPEGWALTLHSDSRDFRALLPTSTALPLPPEWEKDSRVRLTGICTALESDEKPETGLWRSRAFQILMRDPGDLEVLAPPPWWNRRRVVWLLAVGCLLSLAAVGATMLQAKWRLKEQAAQRALAEREFTAVLSERNRMAREIHDTLAQGLGAISMQMELAKSDLSHAAPGVTEHLALAHKLVRGSLAEVRHAIWNMRSQALENADLPAALDAILKQMANPPIATRFVVDGPARRLPPMTENAILRIGQEAITNAVKHANPSRIDVTLQFDDAAFRLRVADDGRGFDSASPSATNGAFGLLGMRERAAQINADLTVQSVPGGGAVLTLTAPIPPIAIARDLPGK